MIEPQCQKEIVHILTDIFPGALIYYFGSRDKEASQDGKLPEVDIAIDVGRRIGTKDIGEAQRALAETHIPYTIYLYDLNGVSEFQRRDISTKATVWKL